MKSAWSNREVELIVADYFAMLSKELQGEPYSKTEHRNAIKELLNKRSNGSIERKHQNISAILLELGYPAIDGYKPLRNYQSLLFEGVVDSLATQKVLKSELLSHATAVAKLPKVDNILHILEPAPKREPDLFLKRLKVSSGQARYSYDQEVDLFEREARNTHLGARGEELVIQFERTRLISLGQKKLANKIEQVSVTEGPSAGFDIRSFEVNGKDRLIEAKTTSYSRYTPFYVTKHELETSVHHRHSYYLYRLFMFRSHPRLFILRGRIDRACFLDPVEYLARV